MDHPFGAAVVGLGVGRSHAAAYASLPESTLVAVCDTNPERLRPVAEHYGATAHERIDALLRDARVEVISVATPHPSHAALAVLAMESGRHVIVEKPMTVDLREADAMIACAQRTGRTLGCIFQRRFWPASLRLHQAIVDGKLGTPISGECELSWWRNEAYYTRDPWRGRWDTEGGGVLCNQGIHALDMFQWNMGAVDTVWARWANLTHPYIEVEDNAVAAVTFTNGALGVIRMSTTSRLSRTRVTVHGSNGATVSVIEEPEGAVGYNDIWTIPGEEDVRDASLAEHVARGEYIYRGLLAPGAPPWYTGYAFQRPAEPSYHARQLQEFMQAIRVGRAPLVDGVEGRKAVALMLALYESGRTGQTVKVAGM
ncbi:MAG: Gfo/Idh/MocA family oxidoreductase [Chloroflexota bacterium]